MNIATWNLSHAVKRGRASRAAAWAHLAALGADVALVQEAGLPLAGVQGSICCQSASDWTTAVVTHGPRLSNLPQPIRPSWNRKLSFRIPDVARPGTLALAAIEVGDGKPIVAISLYGMLRYADQSVLRAVCDLIPLFDTPLAKRAIIGGDFNVHTQAGSRSELRRAGPVLAVLASLGVRNLVEVAREKGILEEGMLPHQRNCLCGDRECSHVRTHRHGQAAPDAMPNNDYLFATDEMARALTSLRVLNGDDDPCWRHSDHCPLIATFGQHVS